MGVKVVNDARFAAGLYLWSRQRNWHCQEVTAEKSEIYIKITYFCLSHAEFEGRFLILWLCSLVLTPESQHLLNSPTTAVAGSGRCSLPSPLNSACLCSPKDGTHQKHTVAAIPFRTLGIGAGRETHGGLEDDSWPRETSVSSIEKHLRAQAVLRELFLRRLRALVWHSCLGVFFYYTCIRDKAHFDALMDWSPTFFLGYFMYFGVLKSNHSG